MEVVIYTARFINGGTWRFFQWSDVFLLWIGNCFDLFWRFVILMRIWFRILINILRQIKLPFLLLFLVWITLLFLKVSIQSLAHDPISLHVGHVRPTWLKETPIVSCFHLCFSALLLPQLFLEVLPWLAGRGADPQYFMSLLVRVLQFATLLQTATNQRILIWFNEVLNCVGCGNFFGRRHYGSIRVKRGIKRRMQPLWVEWRHPIVSNTVLHGHIEFLLIFCASLNICINLLFQVDTSVLESVILQYILLSG